MEKLLEEKRIAIQRRGLMSYPSDDGSDILRQEGIELLLKAAVEPPVIKLPYADVRVRLDPAIGAQMAYYMAIGDYEQNDLDLIAQYVREGDRVMECGGGIGITGVMLAKASKLPVTIIEPNPALHDFIRDTFALNGEHVTLIDACVVGDDYAKDTVDFHVSPSYWWSSLIKGGDTDVITAKARRISALLDEVMPTMLVVDIEGAEVDVLPQRFPESIRSILIEIHTPSIGTAATAAITAQLSKQGFALRNIGANSWIFERY